jgi:hypothetical protein
VLHGVCLQEYAALKKQLLDNTRKSGGAIGLYLLLTVNGQAALLAMIGAAASYGYLLWLCRDVDNVRPTDEVPIWEANKVRPALDCAAQDRRVLSSTRQAWTVQFREAAAAQL